MCEPATGSTPSINSLPSSIWQNFANALHYSKDLVQKADGMKKDSSPIISVILIIFAIFSLLLSCSNDGDSDLPAPAAESGSEVLTDEERELEPLLIAADVPAIVLFVSGEAEANAGDSWESLEIGSELSQGYRVRTGSSSSVEIQISDIGLLVIEEQSEISLSTIELNPDSRRVTIGLEVGSVLNRVNRLSETDSYRVRSRSILAGVRGTSFRVVSSSDGQAQIAVAEGAVTVLPAPAELEASLETLDDPAQREAVLRSLEAETAPVEAGQELTYDENATREGAAAYAVLSDDLANAADPAAEAALDPAQIARRFAARSAGGPAPRRIEAENSGRLAALQGRRDLDIRGRILPLVVRAEPRDARIFVNGELRGQGNLSILRSEDESVRLRIERSGYVPFERIIEAGDVNGLQITVSLEESIQPSPEEGGSQEINNPENPNGEDGNADEQPTPAQSPQPESEPSTTNPPDGTEGSSSPPTGQNGGESSADSRDLNSEPPTGSAEGESAEFRVILTIFAPNTAEISINGEPLAPGQRQYQGNAGDRLIIRVRDRGYVESSRTLVLREDPRQEVRFSLEPLPLVAAIRPLGGEPAKGAIVRIGPDILVADANGTLFRFNESMRVMWSRQNANRDNDNSRLIVDNERYYFSGSEELVSGSLQNGSFFFRNSADRETASEYGRYPALAGNRIVLPTDRGFDLLDRANGNPAGESEDIGERFFGSPALRDDQIIMLSDSGELIIFDLGDGGLIGRIPSRLGESDTIAPLIVGNRAFAADLDGGVSAFDLRSRREIWHSRLDHEDEITDPLLELDGRLLVYSYEAEEISILSAADGRVLGSFSEVAAAPVAGDDLMVFGNFDDELIVVNLNSLRIVARREIGETISARPLLMDGKLILSTESGKVMAINLEVLFPR
jgi:outer membrane protein assembly factor BamB